MKTLQSNEQYHSSEAIGSTLLKKIAKNSVLHAIASEQKESDALVFGSAVHAAILEPESFKNKFAASPKFDRRTKEGKAMADAFAVQNRGKQIIDLDDLEKIEGIIMAIKSHKIAQGMLSGEAEYSYFAKDPATGLELKCRPDYFNMNALIDLKTCQDASVEGFTRSCANFGYDLQAAFYLDVFNLANGTNITEFYFVAVETSAPFAINTFKMGEAEIALGRAKYQRALKKYAEYLKSPESLRKFGYEEKINEIVFPMWAFDKLEE